jgi:hypothetical protein
MFATGKLSCARLPIVLDTSSHVCEPTLVRSDCQHGVRVAGRPVTGLLSDITMSKNKTQTASATPAPKITQATTPAFDLASLTPAQLATLQHQLHDKTKADRGDRTQWNTLVDSMLQEKVDGSFAHTTGDILAALQAKGVTKPTPEKEGYATEIKRIQTRKQLLEKQRDKAGHLLKPEGTYGYKASANSFGPMNKAKILAWLAVAANIETLTPAEATVITASVKDLV